MDNIKLSIDGYKCFGNKNEFSLGTLTVLTGANSAGKSSLIQSLLLSKLVSETHIITAHLHALPTVSIDINDPRFALNLGTMEDVIYHETLTGSVKINLGANAFEFNLDDNDFKNNVLLVRIQDSAWKGLKDIFDQGFCYLTADRKGPEYQYHQSAKNDICDCHGENMGDVISSMEMRDTDSRRSLHFDEGNKWQIQFDEWVDYIFPGIAIRVENTGKEMYRIKVQGDVSTNVGFGITYAAPIIVSALQIPKGGMLIVENPEAHLHAKAQSNMGFFLARMAAAGLRIVVETHSEHVVNGIRRQITERKSELRYDEVSIFFFHKKAKNTRVQKIGIDKYGNLSAFPVDFFDQVRQDMKCIIESGKNASSAQ